MKAGKMTTRTKVLILTGCINVIAIILSLIVLFGG